MNTTVLAAAASEATHRPLTISLFLAFVGVTLWITIRASRQTKTAADYYAGGRSFSGFQNGMAIGGDYMSAASFLGIAGIIALNGYDGFLYSIGFLVAWLVALLLIAELMRNSGKYTMADVLAFRMRQGPVRTAAAASTLTVSIFYLLAQMVGAGALVSLLLGVSSDGAKRLTIIAVGILMIFYVTVGGMKGTTWVQIVKAVLLISGATIITGLVLWKFGFSVNHLLGSASEASGKGQSFLEPGLKYGKDVLDASGGVDVWQTLLSKLDLVSLGIALVLGTAGLPHILIRFYTVPTAREARKSVNWAIGIIGSFYLMTISLGFGAAALLSRETLVRGYKTNGNGEFVDAAGNVIGSGFQAVSDVPAALATQLVATDPSGNVAAPLLSKALGETLFGSTGGAVMLAVISAVAFATILAVVAGLTLASSSSFAHDLYANVIKKGRTTERDEVRVAKLSAFVIGAAAIVLSIYAQKLNVAFLVALAFAVAASGNLPAILYSLFWKRFNTQGAVWAIYGGLISAVTLVIFSGVVSGKPNSLFPNSDFNWFPLDNPGLVSIPLGFLCGWLGTVLSSEKNPAKYAEIEVRALTGVGAEGAVSH